MTNRAAALEDSLSSRGPQALTGRQPRLRPSRSRLSRSRRIFNASAEALEYLGAPWPADLRADLTKAGQARDAKRLQELLDPRVLLAVHINPEARVKVARGPAPAVLQQAGYTPVLVKIVNESGGTQRLRIGSPQSGPVYAGMSKLSGERMQQQHLRENENTERRTDRFLELEMFTAAPMTANLSGLEVEYAVALIYSSEAGRREATIAFDVGQGTQDLGFRAEVPVLFDVKPAVAVKLERARPRRHADDGPVSVRGPAGPRVPAAGEAAGAGSVFPEAHLSRARRGRAAAAR